MGLGAAMLPWRAHLSLATAALILVLPVVAGAIIGGFRAGVTSVAAGFLVYDYGYIPPYNRLQCGELPGLGGPRRLWGGDAAGVQGRRQPRVGPLGGPGSDPPMRTALRVVGATGGGPLGGRAAETIVGAVQTVFEVPGVTLLVPQGERLEIAASAGEAFSAEELRGLEPRPGSRWSLGPDRAPRGDRAVALTAAGRPVGMLALRGCRIPPPTGPSSGPSPTTPPWPLERARLREQALRSEVLEEVDRLRHALVGAVSHDLRTPLATMKVASSTLWNRPCPLSDADTKELTP